jgi:hypothetical protein
MRRMITPWPGVPVGVAALLVLLAGARAVGAAWDDPARLIEGSSTCPEPGAVGPPMGCRQRRRKPDAQCRHGIVDDCAVSRSRVGPGGIIAN